MKKDIIIKPIPLWESILLFGIPGLVLYLGTYYGIPLFQRMGLPDIFLFPFFMWLPIIPLLPVSIILFNREKRNQADLTLKYVSNTIYCSEDKKYMGIFIYTWDSKYNFMDPYFNRNTWNWLTKN